MLILLTIRHYSPCMPLYNQDYKLGNFGVYTKIARNKRYPTHSKCHFLRKCMNRSRSKQILPHAKAQRREECNNDIKNFAPLRLCVRLKHDIDSMFGSTLNKSASGYN